MTHHYQDLRVTTEVEAGVTTITIDRPTRRNAIGPRTVTELRSALDEADRDPGVRVIVFAAAGSFFSAGGDFGDMSGTVDDLTREFAEFLLRFETLTTPTIARIQGPAYGGSLGMIASCDFAIAAQGAQFATPEILRGLFPMMILAPLARVVDRRALVRMMLLGEPIDAEQAKQVGLLSEVVPPDQLDHATTTLAARLASQSPTAMRRGLAAFRTHAGRPLDKSLPELAQELIHLLATEDAHEGIQAFLEKRAPKWTGR